MVLTVWIFKIELSKINWKSKWVWQDKLHKYTLQTNQRHCEEETQSTNSQMTLKTQLR